MLPRTTYYRPPSGGRTFISEVVHFRLCHFIRFLPSGLAESPRIDYLGFEELLDVGEIVVPRVCLGGSCGVWGAS